MKTLHMWNVILWVPHCSWALTIFFLFIKSTHAELVLGLSKGAGRGDKGGRAGRQGRQSGAKGAERSDKGADRLRGQHAWKKGLRSKCEPLALYIRRKHTVHHVCACMAGQCISAVHTHITLIPKCAIRA